LNIYAVKRVMSGR